jgi:hypothetical protein
MRPPSHLNCEEVWVYVKRSRINIIVSQGNIVKLGYDISYIYIVANP